MSQVGYPRGIANKTVQELTPEQQLSIRVALCTNFIPPYFLPVLKALSLLVAELKIFISTEMESDRNWDTEWGDLKVHIQRNIASVRHRKHQTGFTSKHHIHFPYDTVPVLRGYKPDIVISAQLGLRTIQSVLFRALHPRTGLVLWADLSEHSELGVGYAKRMMRYFLLGRADAVIVNGKSGERYVAGLGVLPERIIRMPYVRQTKCLPAQPLCSRISARHRRLLYVGQLIEGKGLHLLLDAFARHSRLDPSGSCELLIAGDGSMRGRLEFAAKASALQVKFLGKVHFDKLESVYSAADIFVFPTLSDTWGVVVNEALAAGLPVLGSRFSQAVNELISEGYNGWTFRPDRADEFDLMIRRALETPTHVLNKMGEAARLSVEALTPEFAARQMMMAITLAHTAAQTRTPR